MTTTGFFETVESIFPDWRYHHPRILYSLIRALQPESVVEVGTYRGYAACYMARALQENNHGRLYCIDDFSERGQRNFIDPVQHWKDNLLACGVSGWAVLIVGKSAEALWPGKIDLAYIDGWHGYQACRKDFDKCAAAGADTITLDDVDTVGPRMVIEEIRESGVWDVVELSSDCGLAICQRRRPRGPVLFSQELAQDVCPGVELNKLTSEQIAAHLAEASKLNGVDYGRVL